MKRSNRIIPVAAFIASLGASADNADVKQSAFHSMSQLTGWCRQEKAAILIDLILENKAQKVVEIGVWGGMSLVPMAYAVKANGQGKVYGIDPWQAQASVENMVGVDEVWWGSQDHESIYQGLVAKINEFGLQNEIELVRSSSADAAPIADIDLLHIDGNHSNEIALADVKKWVPLVKSGGVIVFDDVNWILGHGIADNAVHYLDTHCIKKAEYHGDNIWGIWVKP